MPSISRRPGLDHTEAPTSRAGGPPPPPPPARRPRARGVRGVLLQSLLPAVVGAAVAVVSLQVLASEAAPSAERLGAAVGGATATVTSPSPDQAAPLPDAPADREAAVPDDIDVSDIARQLAPSVARVDVATPLGPSHGSAVVYDQDGVLVTNAHVVERATRVTVTLPDGIREDAEVVGTDARSDLAVLRVDHDELPRPRWADDEQHLEVGSEVVAIGSPFGLDGSVTAGIVSALGRTVSTPAGSPLVDMIQTDAAINPGNSGGALVDGYGQVIGINTAIMSQSGGHQGVGFAIPASTVHVVATQLLETGTVQHAELGVIGQSVDPEVARTYGLPVDEGAVVVDVRPGSPAEAAGLRTGDIVIAVDDEPVGSIAELAGRIQQRTPGETVLLRVVRRGDELQVEVELASRSERV